MKKMQPVIACNIFTFPLELSGIMKFYLISPQNSRETSFLFSLSIGWEKVKFSTLPLDWSGKNTVLFFLLPPKTVVEMKCFLYKYFASFN